MSIGLGLVLKVAGVGFVTMVTSSLLNEAGKASAAQITGLAGVVVCLVVIIGEVGNAIRELEGIFF